MWKERKDLEDISEGIVFDKEFSSDARCMVRISVRNPTERIPTHMVSVIAMDHFLVRDRKLRAGSKSFSCSEEDVRSTIERIKKSADDVMGRRGLLSEIEI